MGLKNNYMEYKGYIARVIYDNNSKTLRGTIDGLGKEETFETETISEVEPTFQRIVDNYIEECAAAGVRPDRAYKGQFNVRIKPELHKALVLWGIQHGKSLNGTVETAVKRFVEAEGIEVEEPGKVE